MTKHTILFVAANPQGSDPLKLGEECAAIQRELKLAPHRDDFQFESRWAVGVDELMRHLTELDPTVIHFSGHGGGSAGVALQDEQGQRQLVSSRALSMMVGATARNVRVVVLNACYSAVQAEVLRAKVDCIVGMAGAIGDEAARSFAIRFYGALGSRRSIGNAVAQGVAALAAKQLSEEMVPRCVTRDDVDADQVILPPVGAPPVAPKAASRRLAQLLASLPVSDTFHGRSALLDGIAISLNRSEVLKLLDLNQIIDQLKSRRLADGRPALAAVIDNALPFAEGSELAEQLLAERAALERSQA